MIWLFRQSLVPQAEVLNQNSETSFGETDSSSSIVFSHLQFLTSVVDMDSISDEYKYNDELSVGKNIAIGVFAAANELKRLVDNNIDQLYCLSKTLEKELKDVSGKISNITKVIRAIDLEKEESVSAQKISIEPLLRELDNIGSILSTICTVLESR